MIAATPVTDTVKRAAADGTAIEATEPRERLWAAQTPQVFRAAVLREAHDAADALAGRDRRRDAGRGAWAGRC